MLRIFAAGPAINRATALLARDTIGAGEWWRPSVRPTSRPREGSDVQRDSSAVLAPRPRRCHPPG